MQLQVQETWVKILNKGLITIPIAMRKKVGIEEGEIVRARVIGNAIVIEPRQSIQYRLFSDKEVETWLKKDKLPEKLAKETEKYWSDIP